MQREREREKGKEKQTHPDCLAQLYVLPICRRYVPGCMHRCLHTKMLAIFTVLKSRMNGRQCNFQVVCHIVQFNDILGHLIYAVATSCNAFEYPRVCLKVRSSLRASQERFEAQRLYRSIVYVPKQLASMHGNLGMGGFPKGSERLGDWASTDAWICLRLVKQWSTGACQQDVG